MPQRLALVPVVASALACHAPASEASAPARQPEPADAAEKVQPLAPKGEDARPAEKIRPDAVAVRGTVVSIRMQNINKALGHYTYNVEIELRHDGVERAGTFDPASVPNPLVVRVDKVFWDRMSQAERDAVAPDGPASELAPKRWKDLAVGEVAELQVTFTSPGLAHRVR